MIGKLFSNKLLMTFLIIGIFLTSSFALASSASVQESQPEVNTDIPSSLTPDQVRNLATDTLIPETQDLGNILDDHNNTYGQVWDPWLTRAAIHAVASEGDWLALASGYLYDNQVHLYRWNPEVDQYDLVWEVGGGIFASDVLTLAFGDTNHNNLVEIIAGGEDGRFYVFEQKHIYDPVTNTENQFELVYTSERLGRIFDLVVEDVDGDYKEDIIVGTLETVRFFEYSDHSGYPFNEEHWIEFEESYSISVTDALVNYTGIDNLYAITALEVADTNSNGLWEVVIGTRAGTVFLLENNGTVLDINGSPFPFMRDDNYQFIWDSGNSIQRAITDFAGGDLDRDGYKEILMVVQGMGAYVLDNIEGEFGTYRIQRDYDGWESDPAGAYPLDQHIDWILNSSTLASVDGSIADFNPDNFTYIPEVDWNVYLEYSGSNATTHGTYPEPLNNAASSGMPEVFPYRTAMAQPSDDIYTTFDGTSEDAWAILDWGLHEEAAGNGIGTLWDFSVKTKNLFNPSAVGMTLSLSQDGETWYDINKTDLTWINNLLADDYLRVEVDNVLNELGWSWYRYLKVNVTSGKISIDSMTTRYFNKPLYDAQSATIGTLTLKGDSTPSTVGFVGTVNGAILAVYWDDVDQDYKVIWDSWVDERYKISKNIFDLETVKRDSTFPAWLDLAAKSWEVDFTNGILNKEQIFTYDAENFYNYREEQSVEFIMSSMEGNLHVYRQNGPDSAPVYDPFLTQFLFNLDLYAYIFPPQVLNQPVSIQDWMLQRRINNQANGQDTYFGVSLVPMDFDISKQTGESTIFDETESGFWLFLSEWDGEINPQTREPGSIDVSAWYLYNFPVNGSQNAPCYPLDECSTFVPVFNNITESIIYDAALTSVTLTNSELSGQMAGILGTSQWAPKVAGYDVIGSDNQDLILTNGKVHLLETIDFANPSPFDGGDIETMFGDLDVMARPDYFASINNDEKGRIWTNAEPVDLDNDGDMDLMLGFARYDDANFGLDKVSYGFTYWENQGTNEEPIWVEQKKAVTNNDPESNFRVDLYTEPVLVFNDYDFGTDGFDATYGYHPVYRTGYPTDLYMFQPMDQDHLWNGTLKRFVADYSPQSSLMLATYPEAKRIDINLQFEAGNAINYGYHVFETWDNDDELNGWTATVQAGYDLDQDGNPEVIVGDFNNNAYVFEHLSNNTFKRAYKTQDFNRQILTDKSPYAHDQFDGIGGTFYRTVFDHADYAIAGVDLNRNGLLEFIMATPDMIFVFESRYTPGGQIQQDTFELVTTIDILNHPALVKLNPEQIKISAMATGPDVNLDGRLELVLGVGPALLIFDVYQDLPDMPNVFEVQETYYSQTGALQGQWRMPGNHFFFPQLDINALVVEDIDQDGWVDIIMAGTDRTKARQIRDGFIYLMQWDGVEWSLGTKPAWFTNTTLYNPITALVIDDQDYDNNLELIVGHTKGVDIYEFVDDGKPELREVITSNPHYQLPTRSYQPGPGIAPDGGGCDLAYAQRYCDSAPNFIIPQKLSPMKDVLHHSAGFHMLATIGEYSGQERLILSSSADNGLTWNILLEGFGGLIFPTGQDLLGGNFMNLESPTLAEAPDGDIWVGWASRQSTIDGIRIVRQYMRYDVGTLTWSAPAEMGGFRLAEGGDPWTHRFYPLYNGAPDQMGYAYVERAEDVSIAADRMRFTLFTHLGAFSFAQTANAPFANGTFSGGQYDIQSFDLIPLQYNSSLGATQDYGLVLAGHRYNESLTFEDDIFFTEMTMNTTSLYNFTRPTRLEFTGINEFNPSLIQEQRTGNLMVTYQAPTLRPYGGLFSMWSDDGGLNWMGPYDMSHPLGLDPNGLNVGVELQAYSSKSGESYRVGTAIGPIFLDYFQPSHPVVAEGGPNGFTMVYSIDVGLRMPRDPKQGTYCGSLRAQATKDSSVAKGFQRLPECNVVEIDISRIVTAWNPYSNFSWYHLGETTALDVGDTDRDGRREIAVASGKQAYLFELTNSSALKLHHEEKWISKPYERDLTDISVGDINGDSFDDIVLTSDRGIVNAFSLLDTNVTLNNYTREAIAPRNTPPPTGAVDPFFALGADFTDRTRFETLKITADEIDDVIVIDDFYIGAGDTSRLRYDDDYNEVLWAHDVPEFGRFTGESQLIDMDGDGKVELIAVFDHAITSIDPFDGSFIWNNTDVSDLDWANIVRNPQIGFIDLYLDSETLDLVVWSEVLLGGVPTTVFYVINFKGDVEFSTSFVGFANPVMKMVDVDVNGIDEILLTTRSIIFPLVSYMFVLKVSGSGDFNVLLDYLGFIIPITDILVGEFDPASQGEDWMYVMDFSALGLFFGIDWSIFPSIYMTFGLNAAGDVDVPDHGTFLGFAPYRGGTLEANVVDTNLDGYDDLIGQGSGGLYTMSTAPSGFALYNLANTYETSAVPYARNSIITGNFCDTDGLPDLVTPISSSSIGCYDSATFSTTPTLQWATDQISFDVIIDVIPGNFDNDSNANEFMIIGRNGFVFIYDNDGPGGSSADGLVIDLANVGLDDEPQRILPYTIGLVTVTTITILRKRKFRLPSFKLR